MRCFEFRAVGLWLVTLASPTAAAWADAPKVVEAKPDDGQTGVDPATPELRVTFDRDMGDGGYSIVGGGSNFPEITGKPRWVDARTIVVPMRLKPGHAYQLSINSARFQNFRSA